MNVCVFTGNLGEDPASIFTADGTQIVNFSLAIRSTKKKTVWIKVVCFNKTAELAEKHLHKGARVGVSAMLDQDKWETPEGYKRSVHKLIANRLEFIKTDGRGFEDGENRDPDDDVPF
jgi:single-strand DNA-binding protein